jgi:TonB family protein
MRTTVLALIAAVAATPATAQRPPTTVEGVTVSPAAKPPPAAATLKMEAADETGGRDFIAIWPSTAYQAGMQGRVTLSCRINVHGLAERCSVVSETPAKKGFGRAALELRPTFVLTPATGPDGAPATATMAINIDFRPPRRDVVGTLGNSTPALHDSAAMANNMRSVVGNPIEMRQVNMLDDPVWAATAGFDDVARAYPAGAGGLPGYAAAHCLVERARGREGALRSCQIIKESPHDLGFGAAALSLTGRFRVLPASLERIPRNRPLWVDIPIRLPPAQEHDVMAPIWLLGVDAKTTPRVFPPEAVAGGLTSGRGLARCTVAPDGAMADCAPVSGQPEGLGFAEAAAKLASGMRMNLWSADGAPVSGGVALIPIRLNLKGASS